MVNSDWVLDFDEVDQNQFAIVGSKALSVALLSKAGFRVPEGFIITALLHRKFTANGGRISQDARELLANKMRPLGEVKLALRPSPISLDKKEGYSIERTVLNIRGRGHLIEAIGGIWTRNPFDERSGGIAMLVQKMINPSVSGLLYTFHPATDSDDKFFITATYGLSQPLVMGQIIPDEISVRKLTGNIADVSVGSKELTMSVSGVSQTPERARKVICLSRKQIADLTAIASKLDAMGNFRLEVQWAIADEIILLGMRKV